MNNNELRKERWPKVIKLKQDKYDYIKKKQKEFKYKTLAGTLDKILNDYEKQLRKTNNK